MVVIDTGNCPLRTATSALPFPAVIRCPVNAGDIIASKYHVEHILGQGGMGVVVAARHMQLGQRVAIKFLRVPHEDPQAVERFLREARAAVQIQSVHVARVMDVGTLEDGVPYIVMEFLVGRDLSDVLKQDGPLSVENAVDFVLQACEAIAEAHAKGIVHRDLKPANFFLTRRADNTPLIKVLDFGISKSKTMEDGTPQVSMTATTALMGSPLYMSPEQLRSAKHVDVRTDIWSLGVILFELLAGRPVYEADTLIGLAAMIASDPAPALQSVRADVPAGLAEVVERCLQKAPEERPQTVAELAAALAPFGSQHAQISVQRIKGVIHASQQISGIPHPSTTALGQAATALAPGAATANGWGQTSPNVPARGGIGGRVVAIGIVAIVAGTGTAMYVWAPWKAGAAPLPIAEDSAVVVTEVVESPPSADPSPIVSSASSAWVASSTVPQDSARPARTTGRPPQPTTTPPAPTDDDELSERR